jgi:hypothetical protein
MGQGGNPQKRTLSPALLQLIFIPDRWHYR